GPVGLVIDRGDLEGPSQMTASSIGSAAASAGRRSGMPSSILRFFSGRTPAGRRALRRAVASCATAWWRVRLAVACESEHQLGDLVPVTGIAPGEAPLGGIERGEERVALADVAEPCLRLEGALAEAIINDVMPDLQDDQPADLRLVQSAATEEVEVIEVPQLSPPAPCCELLGERLLQCRRWNRRRFELVAGVHGESDRRGGLGGQPQLPG